MNEAVINKIRKRGYWRINFQPQTEELELSLNLCKELIEKNRVRLRGWDYPHFSTDANELQAHNNFYHGWVDWDNHIEVWNMYQSTQFIHLLALREDWIEDDSFYQPSLPTKEPGKLLGITGSVVYQMTEIIEFLSRLTRNSLYESGVRVSISLLNTKGRELWVDSINRIPLFQKYIAFEDKIQYQKVHRQKDLIERPKELSLELILYVLERFGWHNPPVDTIKKDQQNLLSRRL